MDAPSDEERGDILFSPSLLPVLLSEFGTMKISAKVDLGFVGLKVCMILEALLKKRNIKCQMPTKSGPWEGCVWTL